MPTFEYIALDRTGKKSQGSVAAESASAARKLLRNRQLHATKLRPISEASHEHKFELGKLYGAKRRRIVLEFTRQLSTMIGAEVQLTEALAVLVAQQQDGKFSHILQNIRDQLLSGENLADGLKEYPLWFDKIYVSMVRVGEATGNLGRSLELLGDYINKKQRLETKIKSAMIYPSVLVSFSIIVTVILVTFVVPKLSKIILARGNDLPGSTKFLMGTSDFMTSYWWIILLGLLAAWIGFQKFLSTKSGRILFDRTLLKLPVIGDILKQSIVARFATTLAALIRSGMPMADSLQVVAEVTGNSIMATAVRTARERIIGGADVATPLRESKVVDLATAHMISVGERTGELEKMLLTIADSLEESTDITVTRISAVMEPAIIIGMAGVVGFIMYSIMIPIMQVSNLD
ncbi:MAG: type II secretion system F family protein [Phycisphaerae bacterium]|nr:type II secretion system F family protein [Phycisphaerae bacterium]